MTRLLVSVRSAAEAEGALAGGADVIDVKDPSRGALGAVDPAVWQQVVGNVNGRVPVSVALGELRDFRGLSPELSSLNGVAWAKLGLAGLGNAPDWRNRWQAALAELPSHVKSVAVIYADWQRADAPRPEALLEAATRAGLSTLLIDTYDKSAGRLLDHLSLSALQSLADQARASKLALAFAGSLRIDSLPQLAALQPEYIAVRGAVCSGNRESEVDEHLVRQLSSAVHSLNRKSLACAVANA